MTELEQLRKVAHEATRYLNGDGSRVQGEEGPNVRIVDENGDEHLVPKTSSHLSWASV